MRADSTGHICRVCVEERQTFREEGEDGVDFKVRNCYLFIFFLEEAPLGSERIKN